LKKPQGGCVQGVANNSSEDLNALFEILEEVLPSGRKAWGNIEDEFASWAESNSQPVQTAKSLEVKFKQVSLHIQHLCCNINACHS
jgi:hypothetical protein